MIYNNYRGFCSFLATLVILLAFPFLSYCQNDYVDFTDMGSYDHALQINKIVEKTETVDDTQVSLSVTEKQIAVTLTGISVENGSRPMKFLQRVVKSILRQINVQSHTFGPGEAITIDLQSEIKYNDYVILNKFVNAEENEEPDKYLNKVDDIMSNLIHVVEHSYSRYEFMEFIVNLPIFSSLKFWLVMITMSVICFLIVMLSLRTVYAANNVSMLLYGFLIIFILSCIWTFSYMYEDAKAVKHAKLTQSQSPPKDCQYDDLGVTESVQYFFRVNFFGYKDQCEAYYSTTMNDPFWSVNPLEAISKSFSVLIFSPSEYIGHNLGRFIGGFLSGIPFWLQPLLVLLIFGFAFLSLFGYRVVSPFFTIEPARREYYDRNQPRSPAITDRVKNELMEKPDQKVIKSIRNAGTDMDGFDVFLNGEDEIQPNANPSNWKSWWIVKQTCWLWSIIFLVLDTLLRQSPTTENQQEEENPEDSFDFGNRRGSENEESDDNFEAEYIPQERQQVEIGNVFIPRRRVHVGLERCGDVDKENRTPCSSSSSSLSPNKGSSSSRSPILVTTAKQVGPNAESTSDDDD